MSWWKYVVGFIATTLTAVKEILFIWCVSMLMVGWVFLVFTIVMILIWSLILAIQLIIAQIPKIPGYYTWCRQRWTISTWRFGWRSLGGSSDSRTPLLSEVSCAGHECHISSKLCEECFRIVEQSSLISGSLFPIIRRREFHKWRFSSRDSNYTPSSCQLCNILWGSIDVEEKTRFTSGDHTRLWAWLSVWKDQRGSWLDNSRYFMQLCFDRGQPENPRQLGYPIPITEEKLECQPSSVHIPTWTGSSECMELAKSWIADCQLNHGPHCSSRKVKGPEAFLPDRLLYVGDSMSSALRLIKPSSADFDLAKARYLALSYCSGEGMPDWQKLTSDKEEAWGINITKRALPLTFQHAIYLTRQLGIGYLFVDALCILQDKPEDWDMDVKTIGKVYANAYCTISSCSSVNVEGGCFHKRPLSFQEFPCRLRFSKEKAMTVRATEFAYDSKTFSIEVNQSPLGQRAEAMQERLLSQRILHFGSRFLFFECNTHIASEATRGGQLYRRQPNIYDRIFHSVFRPKPVELQLDNGLRAYFDKLRRDKSTILSAEEELGYHLCWMELVARYTKAKLERPRNRSMALYGLAQDISNGEVHINYMHGLWRRHLIFDLLWYIGSGRTVRPEGRGVPSWSWQAVDGVVHHFLVMGGQLAVGKEGSIIKVAVLATPDVDQSISVSTESLTVGSLSLRCPVLRGIDLVSVQDQKFSMRIQTTQECVEATVYLDVLDVDESRELFCAELVRELIYDRSGRKGSAAVWSNGLVLQRTYSRTSKGLEVTYGRVGRFWMEWPTSEKEEDGQLRKTVKPMFNSSQIVRIM
ncbi:hypothetical protein B0O99DRAFT_622869 [Bisporella sp. PMI_857]|nr:hypothetical protein B0O99DRAFT_622869 [Bisporella sp. PMI_857]